MEEVILPKDVFESNLVDLLALLGEARQHSRVLFDFHRVGYYIPAAIVSVVATVNHIREHGECAFTNHEICTAFRYFQRMDLFSHVGLNLPEDFHRNPNSSDFIPVKKVDPAANDVAQLATLLGECIDPTNGPAKQAVEYSASENILNCRQHSRAIGYVSAQYAPKRDYARIGIADCGRGILESFRANQSGFYREGMTDTEALELAIQPNVSSTTHLPHMYGKSPNRGVGLSMMRDLVRQTMGYMVLVSGTGWWMQDGTKPARSGRLPRGHSFQGVVCSICFQRNEIVDFNAMLEEARQVLGLQGSDPDGSLFV